MTKLIGLFVCLFVGTANATVIDFEGGLDSQFSYTGVTTYNSPSSNSGYDAMGAHTGTNNWVINPYEASPSTFTWNSVGTFDLTSFAIAGAWGSQTLTVEGLLNNVVQYTSLLAVDNLAVDIFSADWSGLDAFRITTGNDFLRANNVGGNGQHWVLDNLTINESASVPEPASFALLVIGLAGLGFSRKKKAS